MKQELEVKNSLGLIYSKSNQLMQETNARGSDQNSEINRLLSVLKSKSCQLRKIPITLDYDVEAESKNLEILMADLDIQMRLLKAREE